MVRAVVACFGNVLRGDDGFGPAVFQRLARCPPPPSVEVLEVGIGGIHLVQALLDPAHLLVLVDAVDRGRPPGTLLLIEPDVVDVDSLGPEERRDRLADMHYATPERALLLANGLRILPPERWLVGCQVSGPDQLGQQLSPKVNAAVEPAVAQVQGLVRTAVGVSWS